jgi:hypothetical protein
MISRSAFSETIANAFTTSLSIQKMMAKKADNERGIPSQIAKKTGITSDQEPGNRKQ